MGRREGGKKKDGQGVGRILVAVLDVPASYFPFSKVLGTSLKFMTFVFTPFP